MLVCLARGKAVKSAKVPIQDWAAVCRLIFFWPLFIYLDTDMVIAYFSIKYFISQNDIYNILSMNLLCSHVRMQQTLITFIYFYTK